MGNVKFNNNVRKWQQFLFFCLELIYKTGGGETIQYSKYNAWLLQLKN